MNILKKGFIYLAAALAASLQISCQKDDTLQYYNSTMGNIVDGVFISDLGNKFNVVEQKCDGDLSTMKRAFVVCDVLRKTVGGEENEYDVRLTQISSVLTKDVVLNTEVTEDMKVQDPIYIDHAWIAGGYINMSIVFPVKSGSETSHLINLVHEGNIIDPATEEEIPGTYRFSLRHNSYNDKITPPQVIDYVYVGGFVSFPLSSFITEKEAEFSIEWPWHKSIGSGLSSEIETLSFRTKYSADGFQHAPQSSSDNLYI